jgi:Asp/Glu/hydantoin racemase
MALRILYISVLGSGMYDEHILKILQAAAAPDTDVAVCHLDGVPKSPFMPPVHLFYNQLLQRVIDAEAEGFDGAVIGCSSDPGLEDAKKLVNIPVTGPFEAYAHTAPAFGKTTIIATGYKIDTWAPRAVAHGLGPYLASVREANFEHPDHDLSMRLHEEDEAELFDIVMTEMKRAIGDAAVEQTRQAAETDGTKTVFFACTFWSGMLAPIAEAVPGVALLDPIALPLKYIEMLAGIKKYSAVSPAS